MPSHCCMRREVRHLQNLVDSLEGASFLAGMNVADLQRFMHVRDLSPSDLCSDLKRIWDRAKVHQEQALEDACNARRELQRAEERLAQCNANLRRQHLRRQHLRAMARLAQRRYFISEGNN